MYQFLNISGKESNMGQLFYANLVIALQIAILRFSTFYSEHFTNMLSYVGPIPLSIGM